MTALRRQVLSLKTSAERAEVATAIGYTRRGERIPGELFDSLTKPELGRAFMESPECNSAIKAKAEKKLAIMDAWPPDVRAAAHEHGQEIVQQFWQSGIRTGRIINHLIAVVRGHMQPVGNKRPGK